MEINRGQLERDLARAEKDRDKNDAARTEYEQRWTRLEEAKSRIAAQKVRLDSLLLRAPLDGMVLRRDGEVGEIAGPHRRPVLGGTAGADAGRCRNQ
jgi:multidrug resistance efflux pump